MENYRVLTSKPPMGDDEFAAIWRSVHLKVTDTYDTPPEILWVNGSTIGTLGNFSASTGKAKSKKTFNISAIVAAALRNSEVLQYSAYLPQEKRKILYVDTEQSFYHCHKVLKRIMRLAGCDIEQNSKDFLFIVLREHTPERRREIIGETLRRVKGIGLVIIDGIRDLNDDDMMQMQTLASEILSMERGQSKTETGKEHLERNDFIIKKQRAELERIEAERQHKEHQIDLAEQELKQVKSEIRTDKLKSVATDAATALASGVSSLFGSGKMKSLERKNEDLRDEIAIRDETIEQLQSNIKQMQVEHSRAMMNKDNEHRKALEAKEAEHKEETNILNSIINTAHRWYPDFANLLRLERLAKQIGLSAMEFAELIKGRIVNFTGRLFSSEHNRWFATDNTPLQILRDNDRRLTLTANRIPLSQWFCEQYDKFRQSIRQPVQPKKNRGMKL